MSEITMSPCPHCGNTQIDYWDETDGFYYCEKCGLCGPRAHDKILAADRWNALPRKWEDCYILPRRLRWTKERPMQSGMYWNRNSFCPPRVICVGKHNLSIFSVETTDDDEYAGPIPEPEESNCGRA